MYLQYKRNMYLFEEFMNLQAINTLIIIKKYIYLKVFINYVVDTILTN